MILKFLQALACAGSAGHGANRARHCMMAERTSRHPATAKTIFLWAESHTSHGAADTRPATAAPMPSVTKSAGRAQHINVPNDVNKLSVGKIACL